MEREMNPSPFAAIWRIVSDQPFIVTTGIAALIHSTWSLGTMFAGAEPLAEQDLWMWLKWVFPAFLIAFSFDVGQISVSMGIRAGHRSRARFVTFAVLAAATYYCQWLFLAHHMPMLELSAGVREEWRGGVAFIRDLAVWIIPGLLPISTTLYTFGSPSRYAPPRRAPVPPRVTVTERKIEVRDSDAPDAPALVTATGTPDAESLATRVTSRATAVDGPAPSVDEFFVAHPEVLEQLMTGVTSYRKVAELVGVSHTTVMRYVREVRKGMEQ